MRELCGRARADQSSGLDTETIFGGTSTCIELNRQLNMSPLGLAYRRSAPALDGFACNLKCASNYSVFFFFRVHTLSQLLCKPVFS